MSAIQLGRRPASSRVAEEAPRSGAESPHPATSTDAPTGKRSMMEMLDGWLDGKRSNALRALQADRGDRRARARLELLDELRSHLRQVVLGHHL